ncbi:MAG: DUF4129 domain-containing protein [Pseudozobellia sp.]|nr:DUF4129 domain-containing protein [Pseudozobellia sp.]|tara:strand:- start:308 stop:1045 length:738 start_codon:yes stop_codon:yes gene_type:complete
MHRLLILIGSFICSWHGFGQQDSTKVNYDDTLLNVRTIPESFLEKYKSDKAFDYETTTSEIGWWNDFTAWLGDLFLRLFELLFGIEKAAGFLATFLEIVPYILLALLIFLLIKFFLKLNARTLQGAKNREHSVILSEEENIIKNEDIQQLIKEAVAQKNYRLAIRYYYLGILKLLTEKDFIEWQLQKTNSDYLAEINNDDIKLNFSKITWLYDYIWYGDFAIDENGYSRAERSFLELQTKLGSNG